MKTRTILLSFFMAAYLLPLTSHHCYAQCGIDITAFKSGEELSYDLYYNWKFIWMKVGTAEMDTKMEKFEGKVVVWGTKSESAQNKIWRFLNKFNIGAEKLLNNINWALQPTLLISTDTEVSHPEVSQPPPYNIVHDCH